LTFYRDGLGLETPGIVGQEFEHGAVAFFGLQPGLKPAIWNRVSIAHDTGMAEAAPSSTEFTLAHNVRSREEVDELMRQAESAGARISKPAAETFYGGYAGYFQDPDGRLWDVAWNPQLLPEWWHSPSERREVLAHGQLRVARVRDTPPIGRSSLAVSACTVLS
jgi:catechol 2,3-dioxygenase-like lactoylglutathione lyase family enzyme